MTPDEPPAFHHEWMAERLEAMERRDLMRAAFSLHPGGAKTKFCSRYFPAWYLGRNPGHRYLQGGHSQAFVENEFGRYVRDIVSDPKYAAVFPDVMLHPRSAAAGNWRLRNSRGGYVGKGAGQKLAGYRGNIGGIDDALSEQDADSPLEREKLWKWLWTGFRTRLLPNSPMFMVATRWNNDDPIGRVEQYNKEKRGIPWEIFNITAVIETEEEMANDPLGRDMGEPMWPAYYDYDTLMDFKATLPARDWWALYKGKPRAEEGNVVKKGWFQTYSVLPGRENLETNDLGDDVEVEGTQLRRITVSVDCANKDNERAAYTVATVWFEDTARKHYLADVLRKKMEFNEMVTAVEDLATRWGAGAILIEDKGSGTQFLQTRAGLAPAPLIPIKVGQNESKQFRFDGVTPMFEAGEVLFPKRAPWLEDYVQELLDFPLGTSDQVDSTSQYLKWARTRRKYGMRRMSGANLAGR